MVVRSRVPPEKLVGQIRSVFQSLDPRMPLYGTGSLEDMLGLALFPTRAAAVALGSFGLLAIVLAATGIHGVVAYAVSRRRREIGIRIAIGASRREVLRVVLGRVAALVGAGSVVGAALSLAAGAVLSNVVSGVSPYDPVALGGVALLLAAVAVVAAWAPARRSMAIAPTVALRSE